MQTLSDLLKQLHQLDLKRLRGLEAQQKQQGAAFLCPDDIAILAVQLAKAAFDITTQFDYHVAERIRNAPMAPILKAAQSISGCQISDLVKKLEFVVALIGDVGPVGYQLSNMLFAMNLSVDRNTHFFQEEIFEAISKALASESEEHLKEMSFLLLLPWSHLFKDGQALKDFFKDKEALKQKFVTFINSVSTQPEHSAGALASSKATYFYQQTESNINYIKNVLELDDLQKLAEPDLQSKVSEVQKNIVSFSRSQEFNGAVNFSKTHSHSANLANFLQYALRQYRDLNPQAYSNVRQQDVQTIQSMIDKLNIGTINAEAAVVMIKLYFDSDKFIPGVFGSRLQTLVEKAISVFQTSKNTGVQKEIKYQHYDYSPSNYRRKVKLVVSDSNGAVSQAPAGEQTQAEKWAQEGYEVIHYNLTTQTTSANKHSITQLQYDFYAMVDELQQDRTVAEIEIVGRGLGANMVAHALPSLTDMRVREQEQTHYDKSVPYQPKITKVDISDLNHPARNTTKKAKNQRALSPAAQPEDLNSLGNNRLLLKVVSALTGFMRESVKIARAMLPKLLSHNRSSAAITPLDVVTSSNMSTKQNTSATEARETLGQQASLSNVLKHVDHDHPCATGENIASQPSNDVSSQPIRPNSSSAPRRGG